MPTEEEAVLDLDEDIEDNLLRPVGVEIEAIDLIVKAFQGFDMPRSDPSFKTGISVVDKFTKQDKKEECDPYLCIRFAGQKAKSKAESNTYNPTWMQELHVPAMLPSMCDQLSIQVSALHSCYP